MTARFKYLIFAFIIMLIGLASRRYSSPDGFIHNYAGDALWAMMIYFGFRFLNPKQECQKAAWIALTFCFLIEISQLYQAEWLNAIRRTTLGGLILGFGFLWSDLLGYCVGVLLAWLIDKQD
jgi:glycopeptide antibiotics resistance protein